MKSDFFRGFHPLLFYNVYKATLYASNNSLRIQEEKLFSTTHTFKYLKTVTKFSSGRCYFWGC